MEKSKKYDALAAAEKAVFVPFAVEVFGGMGKKASELISLLTKQSAALCHSWAPWEVTYGIRHAVAISIQRGNAAIVTAAAHRARHDM